jgi:DNA-binding transcriptional ArsR family regulator
MSNLASANTLAEVASLIGDAARANMLSALMGGRALTAGELARIANVTAQTASGHLAKLAEARLVSAVAQGRHRYYRIASPQVAQAMDALMTVAADGHRRHHPVGPRDEAMRLARTCYDHMAGRLAVALADRLTEHNHVVLADGAALVTDEGQRFFTCFGIDLDTRPSSKRALCRTCLDWSERRPHLAGQLGAAMLERVIDLDWVARRPEGRTLRITPAGEQGFRDLFGLQADWRDAPKQS